MLEGHGRVWPLGWQFGQSTTNIGRRGKTSHLGRCLEAVSACYNVVLWCRIIFWWCKKCTCIYFAKLIMDWYRKSSFVSVVLNSSGVSGNSVTGAKWRSGLSKRQSSNTVQGRVLVGSGYKTGKIVLIFMLLCYFTRVRQFSEWSKYN